MADTLSSMGRESRNTAIYTAFDEFEQAEAPTPERNLLRAVLLNAVADLRRPGDFNRKAAEYFLSREEDYVFSFHSVCGYLNIDPRQILMLVGLNGELFSQKSIGDSLVADEDIADERLEKSETGAPRSE